MQKLKMLREYKGSVLVGTLAFSIIMAIAGSGFLMLSGNSVRHESAAMQNQRAFLSAESGLLIVTRWMRETANWNAVKNSGKSGVFTGDINGIPVNVDIIKESSGYLTIRSEAGNSRLPYVKILSWSVEALNPSFHGVFINKLGPSGKVGGSGLNNTWFDGPFHSNSPIYLSSVSNPKAQGAGVKFINGPVSVSNITPHINFANGGNWANYGKGNNNYDLGVYHHNISENDQSHVSMLDKYFTHSFTHSQDSLYIDRIETQTLELPQGYYSDVSKRPILAYGQGGPGKATYYYYDQGGNLSELTFDTHNQIVRSHNEVSVLGKVQGKTTLVTDPGLNIYPVGDLVIDDFLPVGEDNFSNYDNSGNYGIGSSGDNENIIALVAGGDIFFEPVKRAFDPTSKALVNANGGTDQVMYVTANLMAYEEGRGIWWETKDGTRHGAVADNNYDYLLRAIGSRTLDEWFSYDAGGVNANRSIRFFFDTRLSEGLRAPGIPEYRTKNQDVELFKLKSDWQESNII